jgi:diaminopimelate epimerase
MANLYELQGQMLQIEYALEENGGELTDELAELLTDTEISIKQKADGYRAIMAKFSDKVDAINIPVVGPAFEHSEYFPEGVNTEFIRVVNKVTIKMRVWERGSGETWACGTGACAAVVAAVLAGYCEVDTNVTVKLRGGDLTVNYHADGTVDLMGNVKTVYEGTLEI